jgi:hypothetical protein
VTDVHLTRPTTTATGAGRLTWSLWLPLGVRVATMLAQVGAVALALGPQWRATVSRLYLWDATYYAHIAAIGYPIHVATSPGGGLVRGGTLAFYPLFPELARLVHLTGLSGVASCLLVAWAASAALGPAVAAVVRDHGGSNRTALIAVALLGALPMSITLQMAYAESTFVLLTVLALLAVQQRRWSAAGVLLLLAGLTRPVGVVAAVGVAGYALATAHASGRLRAEATRIAAATVPGLVSGPLYWAFVALRTGMWDAWFVAQGAGWGTHVDLGASVVEFVRTELLHPSQYVGAAIATAVTILGYLAATVWLAAGTTAGTAARTVVRRYVPWLAAGWLLVIGSSNYWHSKPRLLLVDAVIVIPLALALERRGRRVPVTVGALTVVSLWFGAYMVTGWPYAI